MKKIILLIGIIVSLMAGLNVASAQTEGVITYEVKINLHRRIPKEREEMKAMIPEFTDGKAGTGIQRYRIIIQEGRRRHRRRYEPRRRQWSPDPMQQPKIEIYLNSGTQERLVLQEFMGKEYLIQDTLKVAPWKFGTETKVIQGYECKQAYYTDETRPDQKMEITAWYTDKIRPFLGPERHQSLPGTVLAVDINNGERVMVAKSIELRALKKNELRQPASGSKTTQAAFRKMVDEQMKRMGGSGGVMIRTN